MTQFAAITAMGMSKDYLQYFVDSYKEKTDFVAKSLKAMPFVDVKNADGTFYLFPDIRALVENTKFSSDMELCNAFLTEEYVAMMPGIAFGLEGFARISCANDMAELEDAMQRFHKFVIRHTN